MSLSLAEIHGRRGSLVERAHAERTTVRAIFDGQQNTFWWADRGIELAKFVVARKGLFLVAGIAFAVIQPRRALRFAFRAWGLFKLVRKLSRALA
jgi:hypothetical protein